MSWFFPIIAAQIFAVEAVVGRRGRESTGLAAIGATAGSQLSPEHRRKRLHASIKRRSGDDLMRRPTGNRAGR